LARLRNVDQLSNRDCWRLTFATPLTKQKKTSKNQLKTPHFARISYAKRKNSSWKHYQEASINTIKFEARRKTAKKKRTRKLSGSIKKWL